jgi:hypothetical protein
MARPEPRSKIMARLEPRSLPLATWNLTNNTKNTVPTPQGTHLIFFTSSRWLNYFS